MKKYLSLLVIGSLVFAFVGCNSTGESRVNTVKALTNESNRLIHEEIVSPVGEIIEYTAHWQVAEGEGEEVVTKVVSGILKTSPGVFPALAIAKDGTQYFLDRGTPLAITERVIKEGIQPTVTYHGKIIRRSYDPHARVKSPVNNNNIANAITGLTALGIAHEVGGSETTKILQAPATP